MDNEKADPERDNRAAVNTQTNPGGSPNPGVAIEGLQVIHSALREKR
jgi:hypothetical protein